MRIKGGFIFILIAAAIAFVFLNMHLNIAQGRPEIEEALAPSEPDVQWLWGEVISVDIQNMSLSVKYLDYEEDRENYEQENDMAYYGNRDLSARIGKLCPG